MADSDDDFGDVDDEAMLLAAASAEQEPQSAKDGIRANKRQRLSEPREPLRMISGIARPLRQGDERGISEIHPFEISSQQDYGESWVGGGDGPSRLRGPQSNLRQTTLFGAQTLSETPQSQQTRRHNWPLAGKVEPPTHHRLKEDELTTWVYPTNIGSIRDYQFNIVARGLYHNLLVALPTGLGKTFIAATIMLNWYRWTKQSQIIFVAPTRPLVSQQVDACFNIAGIPRSDTSMLTGGIPPGIRAEEWSEKRVFFMTPQTIINDLKSGICDPKRIVLLVVDEAHRATGSYAYVEVVKFMRRFNTSFRVLALTATPGSTVEGVQEVIDGLGISRVEIRTEDSLDIREYVHQRNIETTVFEYSEELVMCMDLFAKALQPLVNKVKGMNAYWSHNPMTLTAFGCTQARQKWMNSDAGRTANWGVKGMINAVFAILASLAHAVELLKFHGIGPFYRKVLAFRAETEKMGEKGSKHKREVVESEPFKKMMSRISTWVSDKDFVGHPKLEFLRSIALNHFLDAGDGRQQGSDQISPARTRIMVFAHFRDSAEEIVRVLQRNEPMIRPHVFVGQATSQASEGMDQKKQLDIIDKFRRGVYNTLVATSIGEEGLDIGEVDLIVCYDGSASPIRMLQRMGRTGRKRAGKIEVLLMKEKEHDNFVKAKDNYEKMQEMIASGKRFTFHDHLSPRILPKEVQPVVEKRPVEIPIENSQADLPEPKRRGKAPKRPPKKFHMPDNAQLGFTTASRLVKPPEDDRVARNPNRSPTPEPIPHNNAVFLTDAETQELERVYLSISGEETQTVEPPRLDAHAAAQRELRPTGWITHGRTSTSLSRMLTAMHQFADPFASVRCFEENLDPKDQQLVDMPRTTSNDRAAPQPRRKRKETALFDLDAVESSNASSAANMAITDELDDPRYASDLADFIDDGDPTIDLDSATSPFSSPPPGSREHLPLRNNVVLSQTSFSTTTPDLDTLLGVEGGQGRAIEPTSHRRGRRVIESDSDE